VIALERLTPSRRTFLLGGGALIVSFSLPPRLAVTEQPADEELPGSLQRDPKLDSWIRIDERGGITVFTGKCELGQGIKTALTQVAAEELAVAPQSIHLVAADTGLTPNEGYTAGSHSMQDSGTAIRHAAAQARSLLIATAAVRLGVPRERLKAQDGAVVAHDGRRLGFGLGSSVVSLAWRTDEDISVSRNDAEHPVSYVNIDGVNSDAPTGHLQQPVGVIAANPSTVYVADPRGVMQLSISGAEGLQGWLDVPAFMVAGAMPVMPG